jgi:hypothetical protein
MEPWFRGLAALLPGIDGPSAQQIAVSEYRSLDGVWMMGSGDPELDEQLRKGWWRLLLGGSAVLGLLPRLAAVVVSAFLVRRGIGRGLDTPANRAISAALRPSLERTRVGDAGVLPVPKRSAPAAPEELDEAHLRGLAVVPFAAPVPSAELLASVGLDRLGLSDLVLTVPEDDDRAAMAAVTARVGDVDRAPGGVVVVFDFAATPDRVREQFLRDVARALPGTRPVHVLLGGVERFRRSPRGRKLDARRESWLALAERAGVPESRVHTAP